MDQFTTRKHKGVGPGGIPCPCCRPKATKRMRVRMARKALKRDLAKEAYGN